MFFFRRKFASLERKPQEVQERDATSELVDTAREHLHIEGKEALDTESLETVRVAVRVTVDFLTKLGYEKSAKQLSQFAEEGRVFFFERYRQSTMFGEAGKGIEHDGFFSAETQGIGVNKRVRERGGQAGVQKTVTHELIHLASFFADERGLRAIEREGGTSLRRQAGFDILTRRPGFEFGKGYAEHFVFLNEGMTETLASMIDPSEWNAPHPYNVNRLYVELLVRALVVHKQKESPGYSLRDAWKMLAQAYFDNTFDFGKEVEAVLGKGSFQELARPDKEDFRGVANSEEVEKKMKEREYQLVKRVADVVQFQVDETLLEELRTAPRGGSALSRLKQMEDETRRAALSLGLLQEAA